jgi:hypothetical protein
MDKVVVAFGLFVGGFQRRINRFTFGFVNLLVPAYPLFDIFSQRYFSHRSPLPQASDGCSLVSDPSPRVISVEVTACACEHKE